MASHEFEIYLPQWPVDIIKEPQLDMTDILAVQGLAMGYLRKRARTRRTDTDSKSHLMAMLDKGNEAAVNVNDGSIDTFMSYKIQKLNFDQWRMSISFLELLNTDATRKTNTRNIYKFDWLANGNRQAWYSSTTRQKVNNGVRIQINDVHPISSDECIDLQDRMLEVSQAANPISSDSIFIPKI